MRSSCVTILDVCLDIAVAGLLDSARIMLDEAWKAAESPDDRASCHEVGNHLQRLIFERYI